MSQFIEIIGSEVELEISNTFGKLWVEKGSEIDFGELKVLETIDSALREHGFTLGNFYSENLGLDSEWVDLPGHQVIGLQEVT